MNEKPQQNLDTQEVKITPELVKAKQNLQTEFPVQKFDNIPDDLNETQINALINGKKLLKDLLGDDTFNKLFAGGDKIDFEQIKPVLEELNKLEAGKDLDIAKTLMISHYEMKQLQTEITKGATKQALDVLQRQVRETVSVKDLLPGIDSKQMKSLEDMEQSNFDMMKKMYGEMFSDDVIKNMATGLSMLTIEEYNVGIIKIQELVKNPKKGQTIAKVNFLDESKNILEGKVQNEKNPIMQRFMNISKMMQDIQDYFKVYPLVGDQKGEKIKALMDPTMFMQMYDAYNGDIKNIEKYLKPDESYSFDKTKLADAGQVEKFKAILPPEAADGKKLSFGEQLKFMQAKGKEFAMNNSDLLVSLSSIPVLGKLIEALLKFLGWEDLKEFKKDVLKKVDLNPQEEKWLNDMSGEYNKNAVENKDEKSKSFTATLLKRLGLNENSTSSEQTEGDDAAKQKAPSKIEQQIFAGFNMKIFKDQLKTINDKEKFPYGTNYPINKQILDKIGGKYVDKNGKVDEQAVKDNEDEIVQEFVLTASEDIYENKDIMKDMYDHKGLAFALYTQYLRPNKGDDLIQADLVIDKSRTARLKEEMKTLAAVDGVDITKLVALQLALTGSGSAELKNQYDALLKGKMNNDATKKQFAEIGLKPFTPDEKKVAEQPNPKEKAVEAEKKSFEDKFEEALKGDKPVEALQALKAENKEDFDAKALNLLLQKVSTNDDKENVQKLAEIAGVGGLFEEKSLTSVKPFLEAKKVILEKTQSSTKKIEELEPREDVEEAKEAKDQALKALKEAKDTISDQIDGLNQAKEENALINKNISELKKHSYEAHNKQVVQYFEKTLKTKDLPEVGEEISEEQIKAFVQNSEAGQLLLGDEPKKYLESMTKTVENKIQVKKLSTEIAGLGSVLEEQGLKDAKDIKKQIEDKNLNLELAEQFDKKIFEQVKDADESKLKDIPDDLFIGEGKEWLKQCKKMYSTEFTISNRGEVINIKPKDVEQKTGFTKELAENYSQRFNERAIGLEKNWLENDFMKSEKYNNVLKSNDKKVQLNILYAEIIGLGEYNKNPLTVMYSKGKEFETFKKYVKDKIIG